jgi:type I restriction enzyme S subunit
MSNKLKPTTSKPDGKPVLTPKLRFPEFRKGEAWATEPMEHLYSFMRNNALSRDKLNYEFGSAKNIHYGDIHTKFGTLFDITQELVPYINDTEPLPPFDSEDYCVEGDLIFADASEDTNDVGKTIEIARLNDERLLSGQHTILARRKDKRLVLGFGGHLFRSDQIRTQIMKEAQGTKVYAISPTRLRNIEVAFPKENKEQQKIADCLNSLDELIAARARKVNALKTHKQGLMQQLFPREGETQPRRRFPEFEDAREWEIKMAGSLFANRITKGEKGLPIYSVTMYDGMVRRDSFDRNFYDIEDAAGNKKVCRNDIAYNMMRMWQGALGVAPEDCLVSPAYIVLAPYKDSLSGFFHYMFKLPWIMLLLTSHSRGLTKDRLRLYYDDFARIPLPCPPLAEQQRIADCLTSLDDLIAAQNQKLAALKTHKKGLMQQLFPSPEEVKA